MNMICRSVVPLVEPNARSTEVHLYSKSTMRILNTIMPVIKVFTAMDVAKPVRVVVSPQGASKIAPCSITSAPCAASQVARDDKLPVKLSYEIKIDLLTYVCDCQD